MNYFSLQIERICFNRTIMQISVNISGDFRADLNYLFCILSQIFLYGIVLVQLNMQSGDFNN